MMPNHFRPSGSFIAATSCSYFCCLYLTQGFTLRVVELKVGTSAIFAELYRPNDSYFCRLRTALLCFSDKHCSKKRTSAPSVCQTQGHCWALGLLKVGDQYHSALSVMYLSNSAQLVIKLRSINDSLAHAQDTTDSLSLLHGLPH